MVVVAITKGKRERDYDVNQRECYGLLGAMLNGQICMIFAPGFEMKQPIATNRSSEPLCPNSPGLHTNAFEFIGHIVD